MVQLYKAGWSIRRVAQETGRPPSTVKDTLLRMRVRLRPRGTPPGAQKVPDASIREAAERYLAGASLAQVGEAMGLEPASVLIRLDHAGVPRRSQSEGLLLRWADPEHRERWLSALSTPPLALRGKGLLAPEVGGGDG